MRVNWKKTVTIAVDALLAVYIMLAFTAFNKPDAKAALCQKVQIDIQDENTNGFITATDIRNRLDANQLYPLNKPMQAVMGRQIEEMLKRSPFVKTVDCSKTQDGGVSISITQRMPIVRIKAQNGSDYYLDDNNQVMPNSHYSADLIIATGHISKTFAQNYIAPLSKCIMANDFWNNLVEQINVLPNAGIEIVPRVGQHVVLLGYLPQSNNIKERNEKIANFLEKKMARLEKFYKYGLAQVGWNKYNYINLEFDNQIICKKKKENKNNPE